MKQVKTNVSEAELQAAIRKFLDRGGIIRKLPAEKSSSARHVGSKWTHTELGGELT